MAPRLPAMAALAAMAGLLLAPALSRAAPAFDKPLDVKEVAPKSDSESEMAKCTYFVDLMVHEVFDGPTAKKPRIVPDKAGPCTLAVPAGTTVEMEDMILQGRKGPFLLFAYVDAQGAADFAIVQAETGKVIFKDAMALDPDALRIGIESGALKLGYLRGINAPCSMLQSNARCWASIVMDGKIPKDMERQIPDGKICTPAYKAAGAPRDNPSILTYPLDVLVSADGTQKELSRGKIGCVPAP
ncbi:hypothetical protein V5F59_02845 [Xanthobacter autotrophicus DSM 431]|uniref:hypothetical protein n=1 Tax=Xanthobacter nonsaccharivorans TaxID=3119912 RepID=UPI0037293DFF